LYVGVEVTQKNKLLVVQAGSRVSLECEQNDKSYFYMSWYQHRPGQGLQLMVYSDDKDSGNMEKEFTSWRLERLNILNSNLILESAGSEHSAEYWCA
ncbi:hypothetical protein XELAEV_18034184mg, partial [Xenopus laevis]